ncbi:MAG: hypothetical protein IJJ69_10360 [Oscillospiraceae bacterium]|nr:hypothetical protein [Oscillospiraceae bacterium]
MRLFKKCTAVLTAATMLTCFSSGGYMQKETAVQVYAATYLLENYNEYQHILDQKTAEYRYISPTYSLQDLNSDAVPELIISYGEQTGTDSNDIYTYMNGTCVYFGSLSTMGGTMYVIPSENLVISYQTAYGVGKAEKYEIYQINGFDITQLEYYESYDNYGETDADPSYWEHNGTSITQSSYTVGVNTYINRSNSLSYSKYNTATGYGIDCFWQMRRKSDLVTL